MKLRVGGVELCMCGSTDVKATLTHYGDVKRTPTLFLNTRIISGQVF